MKKILLINVIVFLIFQMVVLAIAIDIGGDAIDRSVQAGGTYTNIDFSNPANASGTITTIEIWAYNDMTLAEVAIFYEVSANHYSTRSSITLPDLTSGAKRTFTEDKDGNPISMEVVEGDFIGFYASTNIEWSTSGYGGANRLSGDHIPCTNLEFTEPLAGDGFSLKGIGATEEEEEANAVFFGTDF